MNFIITKIASEIKSSEDDLFLQKQALLKTEKHKFKFKMFDDDGVLYFEGLSKLNNTFEPLDAMGASWGCTEIYFLQNNQFIRI